MSEAVNKYRAELEQDEDGRWSAWIEALPGCAAWGYTQEEALTALKDAAIAYVEDMVEAGAAEASAREGNSLSIKVKLQAIADASRHEFPTTDIEDMLTEIGETTIPLAS
ncbi:MAG: type II toxin-antitoxin system HicB family antitoxin [Dehalococcoidia bacterium]|nr:type II toxin-antitoxin system HicB family antitoxin [Dehalococcoidia bacterium]